MRWRCGRFFTDTIERLSARLLVDETATRAEISLAILGALSAARENGAVFLRRDLTLMEWRARHKVEPDKANTCFIRS
jgi:hypothetical protein